MIAEKLKGSESVAANYIEDVFSTYLYTGNGSTQTINNGIDLAGKGGLVWIKNRTTAGSHLIFDTNRGADNLLQTNQTNGSSPSVGYMTSFNSNGFGLAGSVVSNNSGDNYVSWTFRKQPKFFDVVTFSTDGSGAATFSHALGSTPGCVIIKRTGGAEAWYVYHRSLTSSATQRYVQLNTTGAETNVGFDWISVSNTSCSINGLFATSSTYVAYLFAHNAGGFGLTGTDNVISCGSVTGTGGRQEINLGWEPQFFLYKLASGTSDWTILDNMRGSLRGFDNDGQRLGIFANTSGAEGSFAAPSDPYVTSTGVGSGNWGGGNTLIYIAIRRGPMKVPTDGTQVYNAIARTGTSADATVTGVGFAPDLVLSEARGSQNPKAAFFDRLRGATKYLASAGTGGSVTSTSAEQTDTTTLTAFGMDGYSLGAETANVVINGLTTYINWCFCRAPGFFDEVCYTQTVSGSPYQTQSFTHNLGAVPELVISKCRSSAFTSWVVSAYAALGSNQVMSLNSTAAKSESGTSGGIATPTLTIASAPADGVPGDTYVAYLFASCPGVSKVGSYTGNGSTQTINCGFTGGARFVLIKRTDSTGDWYVYDTARGMTTLTDPYLLLNSTAAESATLGSVTTVSGGFAVNAAILAAINTNAATYIYLAIA